MANTIDMTRKMVQVFENGKLFDIISFQNVASIITRFPFYLDTKSLSFEEMKPLTEVFKKYNLKSEWKFDLVRLYGRHDLDIATLMKETIEAAMKTIENTKNNKERTIAHCGAIEFFNIIRDKDKVKIITFIIENGELSIDID